MNPDGGLVYADGPSNFRLDTYVPPFDLPPVACTPCPGLSNTACCRYVGALNLVSIHDDQLRRRWPWQKRARTCPE